MVSQTKSVRRCATMGLLCLAAMGLTNCEEFQPDFQPQNDLATQEYQSEESPTRGQTFVAYKSEGDSTGIVNDDIIDPIETKPNADTDTERTLGRNFEIYKTEEGDSTGIVNDDIIDPIVAIPHTDTNKDLTKGKTFEIYRSEEGDSTGIINDDIIDPMMVFPKVQKDKQKASSIKKH